MGKKTTKKPRQPRRRKFKLTISETRYKNLVKKKRSKKKMSLRESKQIDDALYVKYCKCLKKFEREGEYSKGYPICMNSVYKNRRFKPPRNAARNCKVVFNKNI